MIVFENEGEIDPRLAMLIGVNVKKTPGAIGFFGTGLKYAIACLSRWGESITIQSGEAEFSFFVEKTEIRGASFGIIQMCGRYDRNTLGFTTELGKQWEPWMVYRELWSNAHDEPGARVYVSEEAPEPTRGVTRVVVGGERIERAHAERAEFIITGRRPIAFVENLEIYEGDGRMIFYRGIAVQRPSKPSVYTYNITGYLTLTEDRTAQSWYTDPVIAKGLSLVTDKRIVDATILAPSEALESRLDYCYASSPGELWLERAQIAVGTRPLDVPSSVRSKFVVQEVETCPTCGRAM